MKARRPRRPGRKTGSRRSEPSRAAARDELRALYDTYESDGLSTIEQESTVNRNGRRDDVWSSSAEVNLSYCVSNEFGSRKARVVSEMATATSQWEAVANVNFVYSAGEDSRCSNSNRNVVFSVRPWTSGGACAVPSGGGCVSRTLVINIPDLPRQPAQVRSVHRQSRDTRELRDHRVDGADAVRPRGCAGPSARPDDRHATTAS